MTTEILLTLALAVFSGLFIIWACKKNPRI